MIENGWQGEGVGGRGRGAWGTVAGFPTDTLSVCIWPACLEPFSVAACAEPGTLRTPVPGSLYSGWGGRYVPGNWGRWCWDRWSHGGGHGESLHRCRGQWWEEPAASAAGSTTRAQPEPCAPLPASQAPQECQECPVCGLQNGVSVLPQFLLMKLHCALLQTRQEVGYCSYSVLSEHSKRWGECAVSAACFELTPKVV